MLKQKNRSQFIDELGYSPLIRTGQLQNLVKQESSYQYYRLFRSVTWVRLIVAFLLLGLLLNYYLGSLTIFLPILSMIISIWVLWNVKHVENNIKLYALLYATFDISIFGYLVKFSNGSYEIGFIFFVMAFNAMLLPFVQLVCITCLGAILLCIGWFNIPLTEIYSFVSTNAWEEIIVEDQKISEIIMLVMSLFITVFTVYHLTKRSLKNEVKALIQHKQLSQILSFNRSIIENFQNGIIIFSADTDTHILSVNKKAIELLNLKDGEQIISLAELSSTLYKQYNDWSSSLFVTLEADNINSFTYQHNKGAEEVFVSFTEFAKTNHNSIIMMTLESVNKTVQQAQEARLVALGQLTAGVAHEIRNPLAAINSATDLLNEDNSELSKEKLLPIISNNTKRINQIINNILGLFKNKRDDRQLLPVAKSLNNFAETFVLSNRDKSTFDISIKTDCQDDLYFKFDVTQLEQILWNLCSNAIKYAQAEQLEITIQYELSTNRRRLYLYVYDNGAGIGEEKINRIFEPFYTGSSQGSGLGLYLVKELCNTNNANITYLLPLDRNSNLRQNGACFRISMPVYFSKNITPKID